MPPPTQPSSSDPFRRVQELFDRALHLPLEQRADVVRRAAASPAEAAQVLALLAQSGMPTAHLQEVLDESPSAAPQEPVQVQSTATGELLKKLETAPKLDGERFALEGEVGKGGMGAVVRIHDRFLNRRLAMKVLIERAAPRDDEERRLAAQLLGRFLEEAQVTSQLDHPGVVPVHELGLDQNGKVFFTMRLVKGRTASEVFADAFAESGEWNLTRALEVVLKVCDTMAYAHDKGVLHRDLKPSNVMVGRFGEVYVMDWGLAKVLGQQDRHDLRIKKDASTGVSRIDSTRKRDAESDTASSVVTMDGHALGTPSYMAPEQARGEELDARADVYAIGAMLYELVTGRAPYTVPGVPQHAYYILKEVVDGPPKRVEDVQKGVPAELVAIVDKAMRRERDGRYASVMELADDVRSFVANRVVKAYRTGALIEMRLWMRRNKALATSIAGGIALLLLGITATVWLGSEAVESREKAKVAARTAADFLDDFEYLSLPIRLNAARKAAKDFVPATPTKLAAMQEWLDEVDRFRWFSEHMHEVLDDIRGHRVDDMVAVLRIFAESEVGYSPAYVDLRAKAFFDGPIQFLIDQMSAAARELEALLAPDGVVDEVRAHVRWAEKIETPTLQNPRGRVTWDDARTAIASADDVTASRLYAGQEIGLLDEDIWGLVPIGMNPKTRLWEFYDLRSACGPDDDPARTPIPRHDAEGRIAVTDGTGIVFVLIPGGTLPAGVEAEEEGSRRRRSVRLDPFLIAKHEVTRGQWRRWTQDILPNGDDGSPGPWPRTDAFPIDEISWTRAREVLNRFGLELPTELQWEYAIRGGTSTRWWTGDDLAELLRRELQPSGLQPAGTRTGNPFGLYDMAANVSEWCLDAVGDYGTERPGDGLRPSHDDRPTTRRIDRGANYMFEGSNSGAVGEQSGFRGDGVPAYMQEEVDTALGIRPVRRLTAR